MVDAGHQLQWRPLGPVEHVVIDGEVAVLPNPQDVEGGGHGAFAGRQGRSHGKSRALRQVLGSNRCSKGSSRVTMISGKVGIFDPLG